MRLVSPRSRWVTAAPAMVAARPVAAIGVRTGATLQCRGQDQPEGPHDLDEADAPELLVGHVLADDIDPAASFTRGWMSLVAPAVRNTAAMAPITEDRIEIDVGTDGRH